MTIAELEKPSVRVPALPAPPPLEHVSVDQRKRIKDIEQRLRVHRTEGTVDDDEFQELSTELDALRRAIAAVPTGEVVLEDQLDADVDDADAAEPATGPKRTGAGGRRMEIKREIRDIEKSLKLHKKKPTLSGREVTDMAQRLVKLKQELTTVQDRKRVVLSFQATSSDAEAAAEAFGPATFALDDRVSLAGLSASNASSLSRRLTAPPERGLAEAACPADGWSVWRHPGLRVAGLFGSDAAALAEEVRDLGSSPPHAIVVGAASLRARGGICAVLRDYHGLVLVLEESVVVDDEEAYHDPDDNAAREAEAAALLQALRIKSRWRLDGDASGAAPSLRPAEMPKPMETEIIGDLKWRDVRESSDLSTVLGDAECECMREFEENLEEVLASDGIRMGLLVSVPERGKPRKFLGFVTYKFWGPPLKAMSISRVAVPRRYQMQGFGRQLVRWAIEKAKQKPRYECDRVSLSAIPAAINFYEHLNFSPIVDEDLPEDDGGPNVSGSVKMEFKLGRK